MNQCSHHHLRSTFRAQRIKCPVLGSYSAGVSSPVGEGAPVSWDEDADRDQDHEGDSREQGVIPDPFFVLC
jgi:hypothetical protein